VGTAALYLMKKLEWTAYVVDPVRPKQRDYHAQHLNGTIERWVDKQYALENLREQLSTERFDLVIDLTPTLDKRLSIELCDEFGVSLVNSTMVDFKDDCHIAAFDVISARPTAKRRPHIVASGMNPGALNAMSEEIIRKREVPNAIIYWEYDDTLLHDGSLLGPSTTWSQGESGDEISEDWTFEVIEEGTILLREDAISSKPEKYSECGVPMEAFGIPAGAEAFLIGHEECVYMGWRHDTAVKFIYGFHEKNMNLMRQAGYGWKPHVLVQHPQQPLIGRDIVGVACRYEEDDSWVGSFCDLSNTPDIPADTNATCILVAAGIIASGVLLNEGNVDPGVHLTHELGDGWMNAFRSLVDVYYYELDSGVMKGPPELDEKLTERTLVSKWLDLPVLYQKAPVVAETVPSPPVEDVSVGGVEDPLSAGASPST